MRWTRESIAPAVPGSQLRGKYLVQNPLLHALLSLVDALFSLLGVGKDAHQPKTGTPRRVLIAMGGHIGDVVIGSSVLPLVRGAWPDAEIGVLTGSWARPVLAGHPEVAHMHVVDHWKLNRELAGGVRRLVRYFRTRRRALREIREMKYDLAIDLYPFFPNSIALLWRSGIRSRVGYTSAGFGALLTERATWSDLPRHTAEYHADLLRAAGAPITGGESVRYSVARPGEGVLQVPDVAGVPDRGYLVIHMGAGLDLREWPADRWSALVDALLEEGHELVFTGKGARQSNDIARLVAGRPRCHNLSDVIGWQDFVSVLAGARLVISVESVAGHLAAGVDTPTVVLMSGMTRTEQWRPLGNRVRTVTKPVPCAPCFRSRGCSAMTCVRGIEVADVLSAIRSELGSPRMSSARIETLRESS